MASDQVLDPQRDGAILGAHRRGDNMAGGLNRQFINDPKGFLRGHIIEMAWGNLPGQNNAQVFLRDFDLTLIGAGAQGVRVRLTEFQNAGARPDAHPIRAYWLPYAANAYCETTLGNQADFMFTVTLTGCTIGVGSGQTPKVSHINYQVNGLIDSQRIFREYNQNYRFDMGSVAVNQADYWIPGGGWQAHTVVGMRRNGDWKFYLNSRGGGQGANAVLVQGCQKVAGR
jgi:hypothetical protein